MAETHIRACSALEDIARPGRHGKTDGEPSLTMGEVAGLSLASVIARKGKSGAAAVAAKAAFGLELPTTPRRAENGKIAFLWAGPDQWLAVSREALNAGQFETRLAGIFAGSASITEQSDGRTVIRIAGPGTRDALAKGLPIDLHASAFHPGDTALTLAAHIGLQIWQIDEAPTYEIAVFRGFAGSFWHFLTEAASEFGYRIAEPG